MTILGHLEGLVSYEFLQVLIVLGFQHFDELADRAERMGTVVPRLFVFAPACFDADPILQQSEDVGEPYASVNGTSGGRSVFVVELDVEDVSRQCGLQHCPDDVVGVIDVQLEFPHLVNASRPRLEFDMEECLVNIALLFFDDEIQKLKVGCC